MAKEGGTMAWFWLIYIDIQRGRRILLQMNPLYLDLQIRGSYCLDREWIEANLHKELSQKCMLPPCRYCPGQQDRNYGLQHPQTRHKVLKPDTLNTSYPVNRMVVLSLHNQTEPIGRDISQVKNITAKH
jgi:hypothetical protein